MITSQPGQLARADLAKLACVYQNLMQPVQRCAVSHIVIGIKSSRLGQSLKNESPKITAKEGKLQPRKANYSQVRGRQAPRKGHAVYFLVYRIDLSQSFSRP